MSPNGGVHSKKMVVFSDIYTALLALALGVVCGTAAFVTFKCLAQYETILKIVQVGS